MTPTEKAWHEAYEVSFRAVKAAERQQTGEYAVVLECGHQVTVSEMALRSPWQCLECFRLAWDIRR
jgi:hypothetical protein